MFRALPESLRNSFPALARPKHNDEFETVAGRATFSDSWGWHAKLSKGPWYSHNNKRTNTDVVKVTI